MQESTVEVSVFFKEENSSDDHFKIHQYAETESNVDDYSNHSDPLTVI